MTKDKGAEARNILSNITSHSKYAKYLPKEHRRETWSETATRYISMHQRKFPKLKDEIVEAGSYIIDKKVLPSMRGLQFAGKPIEISPSRLFNCSFLPMDHPKAFSELMFLLLGGTGVGISVQKFHIECLPEIIGPKKRQRRHLVSDSIEGWATAISVLVDSYFYAKSEPVFDFRDIRPKGALLKTSGGRAPGPQPLKDCIYNVRKVFSQAKETRGHGCKLTTLEVHDIACYIADCVLAGGIRRAALISLFSFDDESMLTCKYGSWWELNPQRSRANNSAVALRNKIKKKDFHEFWERIKASGSGEPSIYHSSDKTIGCNPSLRKGTKVITNKGVFPIEKLDGKSFLVPNLDGNWSEAKCWLSGTDVPLWKLTLDDNSVYYSSTEHQWPIYVNERYVKCPSNELRAGDLLPINSFTRDKLHYGGTKGTKDLGFVIGWLYGDGSLTKRSDTGKYVASFCVSKTEQQDVLQKLMATIKDIDGVVRHPNVRKSTIEFQVGSPEFINYIMNDLGVNKKEFGLPKGLWTEWSEEMIRGFIDGLFSSDGHVPKDTHGVSLTSSHEQLANDVQELLGFYGIKTSFRKSIIKSPVFPNGKRYNKNYTSYIVRSTLLGRVKFYELFSLSVTSKQARLKIDVLGNKNNVNQNFMRLRSIELTTLREDVWDISVNDRSHCFQLPTVTTGNCCEVSLKPCSFCNLTTVNASDVTTQEELNRRVTMAARLGTYQASYTDFHFLRDCWKQQADKEPLLGVSLTGLANKEFLKLDLAEAARCAVEENKRVAEQIGMATAPRLTCNKPEGCSSLVVGSSSGVHAWHSKYYIRRLRLNKEEPLYRYLKRAVPELIEDDVLRPEIDAVLSVPIKAPDGAIVRTDEGALDLLERCKKLHTEWIRPAHIDGQNTHNVSVTVSVKDDEWDAVRDWMWDNRDSYNGISILPYDGGSYVQAPFTECTKKEYEQLLEKVRGIDLTKVKEEKDTTDLKGEVACSGNSCTITRV